MWIIQISRHRLFETVTLFYLHRGVKGTAMTSDSTAKFEEPQLYDVWRMPFEYEDQPGVFKNRPVIVGGLKTVIINLFNSDQYYLNESVL